MPAFLYSTALELVKRSNSVRLTPPPSAVMPKIQQQAGQQHTQLSVHFVAFDVDAKVFDAVKKLGANVVGAADEKQLNSQLEFILQKKILLEEEEPAKK